MDCCFETAEGLTVVDFKTDRVQTPEEIARRAEHYRPQLAAYSLALEKVRSGRWPAGAVLPGARENSGCVKGAER